MLSVENLHTMLSIKVTQDSGYVIYTTDPFLTLLLGSKAKTMLTKQLCCIQINIYGLCRKNDFKMSLKHVKSHYFLVGLTKFGLQNPVSWAASLFH